MADGPTLDTRLERRAREEIATIWNKLLRPRVSLRRTFTFGGGTFPYCYDPLAARSERTVEVPLAARLMGAKPGRVLEVGNVMTKFLERPLSDCVVVDKYEAAPGVQNIDVLAITGRFDLIVSVSTLEHVGLDEQPREWTKALRAVQHLRTLLAPGGRMLATWSVGYNRALDDALREGSLGAACLGYMRRDSPWSNKWRQVDSAEAYTCVYGWPYPGGNAIAVVKWAAEGRWREQPPVEPSPPALSTGPATSRATLWSFGTYDPYVAG